MGNKQHIDQWLQNSLETPPNRDFGAVWDKIDQTLDNKKRKKGFLFWGSAATIVGLSILTISYFISKTPNTKDNSKLTEQTFAPIIKDETPKIAIDESQSTTNLPQQEETKQSDSKPNLNAVSDGNLNANERFDNNNNNNNNNNNQVADKDKDDTNIKTEKQLMKMIIYRI